MGDAVMVRKAGQCRKAPLLWVVGLMIAAGAVRVFFWAYTGRIWEDCLITTLHSENFWRGLGLTHYRPGQPPIHGFTSPLSVLIPLVGDAFRIGAGIALQKTLSVLGGAAAVGLAFLWARHPAIKLSLPATILIMGYLALEHHQILFGMAGMETQVVTVILLATLYCATDFRPVLLGLCCGLCMLARPDFAFWVIIVGLYVLVRDWRALPKVVGVACAIYLPWILFTTGYYGSPVPNTILAKGMGYHLWWQRPDLDYMIIKREVVDRVTGTYFYNTIFQALGPSFGGHGTHYRAVLHDGGWISNGMTILAGVGVVAAAWRRQWAFALPGAFVGVYALYYVFFVPYVFGWYLVPFTAAVILLCARGLDALTVTLPNSRGRTVARVTAVGAYLMVMTGLLVWTIPAERAIQQHIEDGNRKQMAMYLGATLEDDAWIGCEPLGYIGYYSGRPVYDWPGLANRAVVQYQQQHPDNRTMHDMLRHFAPEAIVLRPHELSRWPEDARVWLSNTYRLDKSFSVPKAVQPEILLSAANQDLNFMIYRKLVDEEQGKE
jgi:hypothetical protein